MMGVTELLCLGTKISLYQRPRRRPGEAVYLLLLILQTRVQMSSEMYTALDPEQES